MPETLNAAPGSSSAPDAASTPSSIGGSYTSHLDRSPSYEQAGGYDEPIQGLPVEDGIAFQGFFDPDKEQAERQTAKPSDTTNDVAEFDIDAYDPYAPETPEDDKESASNDITDGLSVTDADGKPLPWHNDPRFKEVLSARQELRQLRQQLAAVQPLMPLIDEVRNSGYEDYSDIVAYRQQQEAQATEQALEAQLRQQAEDDYLDPETTERYVQSELRAHRAEQAAQRLEATIVQAERATNQQRAEAAVFNAIEKMPVLREFAKDEQGVSLPMRILTDLHRSGLYQPQQMGEIAQALGQELNSAIKAEAKKAYALGLAEAAKKKAAAQGVPATGNRQAGGYASPNAANQPGASIASLNPFTRFTDRTPL